MRTVEVLSKRQLICFQDKTLARDVRPCLTTTQTFVRYLSVGIPDCRGQVCDLLTTIDERCYLAGGEKKVKLGRPSMVVVVRNLSMRE